MIFQESKRNKTKEEEELAPEQNKIGQKQPKAKRSSQVSLNEKNNGNDIKAVQKDKREKKKQLKHIKLRHRLNMERRRHTIRLDNRLSRIDPKMISMAMNWKDWSGYYKVVNGTPKGEADRIFKLISNKQKKQDEFIPVLKMLLESVGVDSTSRCPPDNMTQINSDIASLRDCKETINRTCAINQTIVEEEYGIGQQCKEINEELTKKLENCEKSLNETNCISELEIKWKSDYEKECSIQKVQTLMKFIRSERSKCLKSIKKCNTALKRSPNFIHACKTATTTPPPNLNTTSTSISTTKTTTASSTTKTTSMTASTLATTTTATTTTDLGMFLIIP